MALVSRHWSFQIENNITYFYFSIEVFLPCLIFIKLVVHSPRKHAYKRIYKRAKIRTMVSIKKNTHVFDIAQQDARLLIFKRTETRLPDILRVFTRRRLLKIDSRFFKYVPT